MQPFDYTTTLHGLRARVPAALACAAVFGVASCQDAAPPLHPAQPDAPFASAAAGPRAVPDQYIVVFRDDVVDAPGLARRLVAQHGGELKFTYTAALSGFAAKLPAQAVEGLRRNPNVTLIEPDGIATVDNQAQTNAVWGLDRLDQRPLPVDKVYRFTHTGEGVTAYIFDSGIRFDHLDFEGRAVPGFDAFRDGRDGGDCTGHGTHVAGTVGGRTYGVAKRVRLVSVRVISCDNWATWSDITAGIDWVIRNNAGPAVANMSLGGGQSSTLDMAVRRLIAAGVQVAMSAGNDNADACTKSPGAVREGVTVAASSASDARRPTSNWGACIDLFAPGSQITSASHTDPAAGAVMGGTSMAAPHVAGVMALWLHENPALTPAQLHEMLIANATRNVVTDAKSANAHLLHSLRDGAATLPPPNAAPAASFAAACTALTCSFDASASSDSDGTIAAYAWSFGDGSTGTGRTVSRSYAAGGSYTVTLTVTDDRDATGTRSASVSPTATSSPSPSPLPPPPTATIPDAPGSLAHRLIALNRVDLSWADRSGNEDGFEIQRRTGGGSYTALARVAANATTFSDVSAVQNATYSYRVLAFNAAGSSGASNETTVTVSCRTKGKSLNCQ